ncbi:MAG: 1,6-anhydro-N-acetylmuramyl-L-alanine amidase AmpD [Janthinobacterium lividum]
MNPSEDAGAPMHIGLDGWCIGVKHLPSPNCDQRPADMAINLLVIHNISLPPGQFGGGEIAALFSNQLDCSAHPYFEQLRPLRVSAHFLIDRQGMVTQFVAAGARAWHAGLSAFHERARCNDFSIGIELEGTDFEAFTELQYRTLAQLTRALKNAYPLTDVSGHEDIAPGRKTDPGPFFDWKHYQRLYEGYEVHTETAPPTRAESPSFALLPLPQVICGDGAPPASRGLRFRR